MTPLMKLYTETKAILPKTTLLFFRLGDFYEAFFDDAATAAKTLGLSLTKRCGTHMCGFPYHAVDRITDQLCKAGFGLAIRSSFREFEQPPKPLVQTDLFTPKGE